MFRDGCSVLWLKQYYRDGIKDFKRMLSNIKRVGRKSRKFNHCYSIVYFWIYFCILLGMALYMHITIRISSYNINWSINWSIIIKRFCGSNESICIKCWLCWISFIGYKSCAYLRQWVTWIKKLLQAFNYCKKHEF